MRALPAFPDPVNETTARVVAGGVVAMTAATLVLDQPALLAPLTYGFASRVAAGPTLSPLGQLATRVITPRLPVEHRYSPGPPKRLAQGMGLAMSGGAILLRLCGRRRGSRALLGLLLGAASLEAFAGICLACKLFPLMVRVGLVSEDACPDCANITRRESRPEPQPAASTSS